MNSFRRTLWAASLVAALLCAALPLSGQDKPDKKDEKKEDPKKAAKNELPLEPVRKIEFETDEATWLSVDMAPDGQSLVFELLGDLYRLPIAGGDATRITDGMPYDAQPRSHPTANGSPSSAIAAAATISGSRKQTAPSRASCRANRRTR